MKFCRVKKKIVCDKNYSQIFIGVYGFHILLASFAIVSTFETFKKESLTYPNILLFNVVFLSSFLSFFSVLIDIFNIFHNSFFVLFHFDIFVARILLAACANFYAYFRELLFKILYLN